MRFTQSHATIWVYVILVLCTLRRFQSVHGATAGYWQVSPKSHSKGEKSKPPTGKTPNAAFFSRVEKDNKAAFDMLSYLMTTKQGWSSVGTNQGVTVERRNLKPGPFVDKADAAKAGKHACVKSTGLLNCNAESVFRLFMDRSRVGEYNEHVTELRDVHYFPKKGNDNFSKITWACGPNYGPFKARDFISVVHFQKYANGTYVILNRPAYHSDWKPNPDKYVRATVLLAGNVIEPRGPDGKQCFLTQIAHVNPGGLCDTPAVAWIINKLCATGPPTFIRKLEKAAAKRKHLLPRGPWGMQMPIMKIPKLPTLPATLEDWRKKMGKGRNTEPRR